MMMMNVVTCERMPGRRRSRGVQLVDAFNAVTQRGRSGGVERIGRGGGTETAAAATAL